MKPSQNDDGLIAKVWPGVVIENVATLAAATATILGLYALGAGTFSLVGFLFLLNITYIDKKAARR